MIILELNELEKLRSTLEKNTDSEFYIVESEKPVDELNKENNIIAISPVAWDGDKVTIYDVLYAWKE